MTMKLMPGISEIHASYGGGEDMALLQNNGNIGVRRKIETRNGEAEGGSDDDLVAAMAAADSTALAVAIERHGGRISALARRMLGPGGDVDDIVQETFLRLWTRAALWQPGRAKLSTWLHRVASNLAIDRLRRQKGVSLDEAPEQVDGGPLPDAGLVSDQAASRIDRAMETIAPRQRLAISLCHYQEMSNIDAAEIMGISVDALESLLARGRRNLKTALDADRDWLMEAVSQGQISALAVNRDGANEN